MTKTSTTALPRKPHLELSELLWLLTRRGLVCRLDGGRLTQGPHEVTITAAGYQVEGGPSFATAAACADALGDFDADHG